MAVTRANVTLRLACDPRPALRMLQLEAFWARTYEGWSPRGEDSSEWIHPKSNALSALLPALIPAVIAKQHPAYQREDADAEPRSTTPEPESSAASPSLGRAPR